MYTANIICIKAGEESPLILTPSSLHNELIKELIHAW